MSIEGGFQHSVGGPKASDPHRFPDTNGTVTSPRQVRSDSRNLSCSGNVESTSLARRGHNPKAIRAASLWFLQHSAGRPLSDIQSRMVGHDRAVSHPDDNQIGFVLFRVSHDYANFIAGDKLRA